MLQLNKICKRISSNLQLIPPSENPTRILSYTSLLMTPLHEQSFEYPIILNFFSLQFLLKRPFGFSLDTLFYFNLTNFPHITLKSSFAKPIARQTTCLLLGPPFRVFDPPQDFLCLLNILWLFLLFIFNLSSRIVKVMTRTTIPLPNT